MVLAWHNPMLLAEQVATVDVLSGGRVDLGIGQGYRHNEFHGFAMDATEAEARFNESLDIMTRAWTSRERFSYEGKFWRFDDVVLEPPPLQSPHPPLWVSAGRDASITAAAKRGLRLLLDQFTPVETIAHRIEVYRRAAGSRFDPAMIGVARDVYIGESAAEISDAFQRRGIGHQRMIDAARAPGAETGSHILAWIDRPEARTEAALFGTRKQVAAKLRDLEAAGGLLHTLQHPGASPGNPAAGHRDLNSSRRCSSQSSLFGRPTAPALLDRGGRVRNHIKSVIRFRSAARQHRSSAPG